MCAQEASQKKVKAMFIVLIGTAGSGKSTLASYLKATIEASGNVVVNLNFDPAAESLPYEADIDIRDYIKVEDFMARGYGPNGSMIAAVDSIINYANKVREEIYSYRPDFVIIDTPGQLELFAYRIGGPIVLESIVEDEKAVVVFLMDSIFFDNPADMVSILTLASSVNTRLKRPQINVISKSDLIIREVLEKVIPMIHEEGYLESMLRESNDIDPQVLGLSMSLARVLYESGYFGEIIPVSVYDEITIKNLYGKIQEILSQGEDKKIYDTYA